MGDLIKHLSTIKLQNNPNKEISIEINRGDNQNIIHIQSESWRIELSEHEFREFATCMFESYRNLIYNKKI